MIAKTGRFPALQTALIVLVLLMALIPSGTALADLTETETEAAVEEASTEAPATEVVEDPAPEPEAPAEDLGVIAESGSAGDEESVPLDADSEPAATTTSKSGANTSGPYDPNGVGEPSGNGNGSGGNKPCAGCVGNADDKNPPGQLPGPDDDGNNGYECDGNSGVGKTNPAHSGCKADTPDPDPDILLVKTGPDEAEIGETITYAFDVTNTGDTALTNVNITDPLIGGGAIAVQPPSLAIGESGKATAEYTVDEADINADDEVHNTATVHGTDPDGDVVTSQDSHVVEIPPVVIVVPKRHTICHATGKPTKFVVITPSVKGVYNGHLGFSHHQARDIIPPFMYDANGDGVEESFSQNWTAEGQAIFNAGCVAPAEPAAIDLEKSGPDFASPGEVITYRFDVTNTGDVDLTDVHVTDPLLGGAKITVNPPTLEANGGEGVVTAQYTIPDDAQPGSTIPNTATATGTPPTGDDVHATDDHLVKIPPETVPKKHTICHATGQPGKFVVISPSVRGVYNGHLGASHHQGRDIIPPFMYDANGDGTEESYSQNWDADGQAIFDAGCKAPEPPPEIDLEKSGPDFAAPGDVITYEFDVTNTGDVDLTNVHVTDPLLGGARITVEPSTLEANGGEGVATAEYTIPEDAIPFSTIPNTATATGTPPTGQDVSAIDDHVVTITPGLPPPPPGILLEKDGPVSAEVGETVVYTFRVTNTGLVPLTNVVVVDPLLTTRTLAVTPSTLRPGQVGTASGTYTVTKADRVVGEVVNTATGRGTPPSGRPIEDEDDHIIDVPLRPPTPRPGIELEKSGPATAQPGDVITYRFRATNTRRATLTNVYITDPRLGIDVLRVTPSTLLPGESGTATATYTVTAADAAAGRIRNTAIVTGTPPRGIPITDTDTHLTLVPGDPDDPDDPDLPATGTDAPTQLLLAALALMMGAGLLLMARRTTPQFEAWTTGTTPARRLSGSDTPPAVHRRMGGGGPTPAF